MAYCTGSHTKFYHRYHIVWVTKYRFKVLHGDMRVRLREIIRQTCSEMGVRIEKGVLSNDHVHMIARMWAFWALSPIPRMRISSIIRSRSGVIFSFVMGTSCPSIEKVPIVRQVRQISKCAAFRANSYTRKKRHCRGSGFVLVRNSVMGVMKLAAAKTNGRFPGCGAACLSGLTCPQFEGHF